MIICENRSIGGDNYARTQAVLTLRARLPLIFKLVSEELPEKRIVEHAFVWLVLHYFRRADVHNGRQRRFQHTRKTVVQASEKDGFVIVRDVQRQRRSAEHRTAAPVSKADIQRDSADNCRQDHYGGHPAADVKFSAAHDLFLLFPLRALPLGRPVIAI